MRDPGQPPQATEETIQAIWSAHGLGPVTQLSRPQGGVRNLCFYVNDCFVLRVNTQDPGSPKFQNERLAYQRLAREGLPVPRVRVLDESHALVPHTYLITTRLPGQSLAAGWQHLPADRLQDLLFATGQALARIHGCTYPAFGKLHALHDRSWAETVDAYAGPLLRSASDGHLLDPGLRSAVERSLARARVEMEAVQPALTHCDFHYENVLHVDGRLSGLLDFEWARSGDPAYDFAIRDVRERMVPESEGALLAGYRSVRALDEGHPRRVRCYRIVLQLERAVASQRLGESERVVAALRCLRQLADPAGVEP